MHIWHHYFTLIQTGPDLLTKTTYKEAAIPSVYVTNAHIGCRCYTDLFSKETEV